MTALRWWGWVLLWASILGGLVNLIFLRDGEVAAGVLLGGSIAVTTLVGAPLLERYER